MNLPQTKPTLDLAYGDVVRIPELKSFTRQRVFTLRGYFNEPQYYSKVTEEEKAANVEKAAAKGEPRIQFSAEAMVLDGQSKPTVPEVKIGDLVRIEGQVFAVAGKKWGDDARLIPVEG